MKWMQFFTPAESLNFQEAESYISQRPGEDITILDVRQPSEYEESHIPGATLIKGIRSEPGEALRAAEEASGFDAVLLDTFSPGRHGGTGMTHDWRISEKIRKNLGSGRLILAGGLDPSNVQEAIRMVRPYAVDVSTGVELSPGIKDHEKIASFIENVMEARL